MEFTQSVLIPELLNKPFASCSFTNLDFSIPQIEHFDCITNLLFFVVTIFWSIFSVSFLHFTHKVLHVALIVNLFFVLKILIYLICKQHSQIFL